MMTDPEPIESALDPSSALPLLQDVTPVQFEPLVTASEESPAKGLDMLSDVLMQVSLELGRARMTLREVLALRVGGVIELDKLAGEPGDVYLNGTIIGRGEIVVVDDRFGIRVFEVVDPRAVQDRF